MSGGRSDRDRHHVSYAELHDDEIENPPNIALKKRVIDSDEENIEEFQPKRTDDNVHALKAEVNNVLEESKKEHSKPSLRMHCPEDSDEEMEGVSKGEDPIVVEDVEPAQRPSKSAGHLGRVAARVSKKARRISDSSESDQEEVEEEEEEEEPEATSEVSDENEEDEEDITMDSDDSEHHHDVKTQRKKSAENKDATHTIHSCQVDQKPSRSRNVARRSARAGAIKTYNEDDLAEQYYSEDDEDEDAPRTLSKRSFDSNAENRDPDEPKSLRRRPTRTAVVKAAANKKAAVDVSDDDYTSHSSSSSSSGEEDGRSPQDDCDVDMAEDVEYEEGLDDSVLAQNIERILAVRGTGNNAEFRVKIVGWSYRRALWISRTAINNAGRQQLARNFERKAAAGLHDPYGDLCDGVHPDWEEIDRIIASKENANQGLRYLVKWRGLGYSEATWERADDLKESEADKQAVSRYLKFNSEAEERLKKADNGVVPESTSIDLKAVPTFSNGRKLRSYQLESLEWMAKHWCAEQNCILGDEMGLGKTAQSISVLAFQRQFAGRNGPHLIIAPLTTLGHWQREIETWTDMDCIVYSGSGVDRSTCLKYDFYVPGSGGRRSGRLVKPHVVLSSYETVLRDSNLFTSICWETMIIDEAHRMKTVGSSTRSAIASINVDWLLLLTGTPVQNNMRELFGLLNLVDPIKYNSESDFLRIFGDEKAGMSPEQLRALQSALKPILLRRMKEDVETLPEKEECIIWTQLTTEQRAYYRAILEKEISTLLGGHSNKNVPKLRNLAMELRKVCCHPYLCDGLEDDVAARRRAAGLDPADEVSSIVNASGKMLLLHKLLPKLRSEGHKVLIFSQFKIMLDVLEDYMKAAAFPVERIDGSTSSRDRQAAIDRYSKEGSDGFVFLLSTRAGGQGITLTAADTCIIYDSDWNPQNDLQAMARCHRIGQQKDVTIYRLVSKDTYEEHLFRISSRKYGLDEAILGGIGASGSNNGDELDGKKIIQLLKHGAHCLDDTAGANTATETDAFAAEDIDQILKGRTEKRQIGGRAGNTFSIATFEIDNNGSNLTGSASDDKAFWSALLPSAVTAHEENKGKEHIILAPRQRKRVSYTEKVGSRNRRNAAGTDSDFCTGGDDSDAPSKRGAPRQKKQKKEDVTVKVWTGESVFKFFDQLLRFGFTPLGVERAAASADIVSKGYTSEDIKTVAAILRVMLDVAPSITPTKPRRVPLHHVETKRRMTHLLATRTEIRNTTAEDLANGWADLEEEAKKSASEEIARIKAEQVEYDKKINAMAASFVDTALIRHNSASPTPLTLSPAFSRALHDAKLCDRILRGCEGFIPHVQEVDAIMTWSQTGDQAPVIAHMGIFPHFWQRDEDTRLLKGLVTLGYNPAKKFDSIAAVLAHPQFGFQDQMVLETDVSKPNADGASAHPQQGDSFQVHPGNEKEEEDKSKALVGTTTNSNQAKDDQTAPINAFNQLMNSASASVPRVYKKNEWERIKEHLAKEVVRKAAIILRKKQENDAMLAAGRQNSVDDTDDLAKSNHGMDISREPSRLDSIHPASSSDDLLENHASNSSAPILGTKGSALLKQAVHRSASAALAAAAAVDAPTAEDVNMDDVDPDPIEDASSGESDDDVDKVQNMKKSTATPGSAVGISVFKETQGGFSGPRRDATSDTLPKPNKKVKSRVPGGKQMTFLDMPKVQPFLTKSGPRPETAAPNDAEGRSANANATTESDDRVIDLALN